MRFVLVAAVGLALMATAGGVVLFDDDDPRPLTRADGLEVKVAALHAQSFPDAVVLETVNDLERLATGLSQKIWQKITIIDRELSERTEAPAR